jgi:hypothetical protein
LWIMRERIILKKKSVIFDSVGGVSVSNANVESEERESGWGSRKETNFFEKEREQ